MNDYQEKQYRDLFVIMSTKSIFLSVVTFICFLAISPFACAAPDAGQILQEIEKKREMDQLRTPKFDDDYLPEQDKINTNDLAVLVTSFVFSGNELIKTTELEIAALKYLNQELTFNDLQQLTLDISNLYKSKGYVARVFLPEQDLLDGEISIEIIEAILGNIKIENESSKRFNSQRAIQLVEFNNQVGNYLNQTKIDRSLLLLNDMPGITASGSLSKGIKKGNSDLLINLQDSALMTGDLGFDNTGAHSTGGERLIGRFNVNSPLMIGDQINTYFIHSKGTDFLRLGYSLPVGLDGLRVGVSTSFLEYDIVGGDFKDQDLHGNSYSFSLNANYPILRSRAKNLYVGVNYDQRSFENKQGSDITTDYSSDNVSLNIDGNLFDKFLGGGANSGSLTLTRGHLDLSNQDNRVGSSPGLQGNFTKLNYYLSRQQYISNKLSFFVSLTGQEADQQIDTSERFYLGGSYGVRAYPTNEGSGSDGQLLKAELRWRLPKNVVLTGFYDLGHVSDNETSPKSYSLKGAGLSATWVSGAGVTLGTTWARRIGENPNKTSDGHDQDGTLDKDRFWLQLAVPF